MKSFPAFLLIQGKACLVVGGGSVAARKIIPLSKAGANVTVVSPELHNDIKAMLEDGKIHYKQRTFQPDDLENTAIAIAATDDVVLNQSIAEAAKARNIPINVVNDPDAGTFIMPSIVERDPVTIAVSSGGASPVLSRLLRARLETMIPGNFGKLASLVAQFRQRAIDTFPVIQQRRRFWEKILQGQVAELLFAGQERRAEALLQHQFDKHDSLASDLGEVYLVGGGPGDPDLLTFRALRLMQQADVVLYDRLVAPAIVDLVNKDAERIYVGKARSNHSLPQQEINQRLVDLAKEGKRVLRLKGGDPFIFGRGGEEIDLLAENHIPFQVVPGITAANGCSSYAGIPLTHRDYAQSCLFITGHLKDGTTELNWPALVQPGQTLAVYMGTHGVDILSRELIKHGMSPDTPIAIIQQGTTEMQQVYVDALENLPDMPDRFDVKPPSMIIIGEVVKLRQQLAWFEENTTATD